ncbi:MAG: septum formation initiator family protein [Flavobacteriaceae bacterium]|nr:septum formation initiator family protein [Flavobacteriaceae bacterium]MDG2315131.1 septum formation initiator family protein [Flavobacteriaceae bacterium]
MFKKLRTKKWFSLATNLYLLVGMGFLVWMIFLDANSLIVHYQLDAEIRTLKDQKIQLEKEIAADNKALKELQDLEKLEKYARENYFMKKEGEEIFLIEINDSLLTSEN